ncbi:MAG: hypothetical protein DA408_05600 [Bacteroidetes bacterium]|nr:MAG: hypothetical protein C7N36_11035 [Bacteroidota bacterium]PTM13768.1 MAG: hypothetical protein DA408_05600 [Bacteroidota bacterium]
MLSRRNVRVKVMQVLYAINREQSTVATPKAALRYYNKLVDDSFQLYLYNLLVLLRVAEYSRQDEIRRSSKLRPSQADTDFTAKLANNPALQSLAVNTRLNNAFGRLKQARQLDADLIRQLYTDFAQTEGYLAYLDTPEGETKDHQAIYLELYKFLLNNETFESILEDHFPLWTDDKSLVVGAMKKTIKALPVEEDFLDEYVPEGETIQEFGEKLLEKAIEADVEMLAVIEPSLKNWDAERVAILDMILIKMALTEFLYFPSIPTKVTLNEFVEISKLYSTDKSKDFINGILDRLLKKLSEDGLINKQGRGLKE